MVRAPFSFSPAEVATIGPPASAHAIATAGLPAAHGASASSARTRIEPAATSIASVRSETVILFVAASSVLDGPAPGFLVLTSRTSSLNTAAWQTYRKGWGERETGGS